MILKITTGTTNAFNDNVNYFNLTLNAKLSNLEQPKVTIYETNCSND